MSRDGWAGQLSWEQRHGGKRLTVICQPFLKARTGTVRWAGKEGLLWLVARC